MKMEWTGERIETGIHSTVTVEHLHRYALALEFVQDKTVLDIACGEGYGSNLLAQKAITVTGVDIDDGAINRAKEKYRKTNLSFLQGTVEAIPLPDQSVDTVISFETLEHTANHQQFLSEIKRVLRPGGLVIISTPDKKWYSDQRGYCNPFHQKELYEAEFEELMKKSFAQLTLVRQKFLSGSVIFSDENGPHQFYEGNFDQITKLDNAEAPYMIAIASDFAVPAVSNSFFNAADIFDRAVWSKEKDIKNSLSYRLGHLLLSPAKWIKKLLKQT